MVLQVPPHLLTLTVNELKRVSFEFISTSIGLASHGWLFRDAHSISL